MLDGENLLHHDAAAKVRHAPFFQLGARLVRFGSVLPPAGSIRYPGASPDCVTPAVLALFTNATKTFRGIHHLGGNVPTEPAVMLVRSLSECWASMGFIVADPARRAERADWYLIGELVEAYKWAKALRDANLGQLMSPETLRNPEALRDDARHRLVEREVAERGQAGAEERAEAMLRHMLRGWWGGVKPEDMYEIAERWANGGADDDVAAYVTVFKFASGVLHVRKPDMFLRMTEDGTLYPNLRADPTYLAFALFISDLLYISLLRAVNEVFGLPWGSPIQGFLEDLKTAAAAAKAQGAGASTASGGPNRLG